MHMTRVVVISFMVLSVFQLAANATEVVYFNPVDFFPGINLRDFVIGVQGGISGIFLLRKPTPRAIIGSVIAGGFTANYAGAAIAAFSGGWLSHDLSVYLSGVGGLAICHGVVEIVNYFVNSWTKRESE
jgi:hypothetical protein